MNIHEFYDAIGGNYNEAAERLMRDSLIQKFVLLFRNDPGFAALQTALEQEDWDAAFSAAHTLKGVSLNLAFARLSGKARELTDFLRPQNRAAFTPAGAQALFSEVQAAYTEILENIAQLEA